MRTPRLLNDGDAPNLLWHQALEIACAPNAYRKLLAWRRNTERPATLEEVHFSINRLAIENDNRTPFRHEYDRLFDQLIESADNPRQAIAYREQLRTSTQILQRCKTWDRACRVALRKSPEQENKLRSTPIVDGIRLFVAQFGCWPERRGLELWAADPNGGNFSLANAKGKSWTTCLEEAAPIVARNDGITDLPPRGTKPEEVVGWAPRSVDVGELMEPRIYNHTWLSILRHVRAFRRSNPGRRDLLQKDWQEYARTHPGAPSPAALREFAPLDQLLRLAARPDWEEHAHKLDEERRAARAQLRRDKEDHQRLGREWHELYWPWDELHTRIVDIVAEHGTVTAADLRAALADRTSAAQTTFNVRLQRLRKAGRIEFTDSARRSRTQAYRLTADERRRRGLDDSEPHGSGAA